MFIAMDNELSFEISSDDNNLIAHFHEGIVEIFGGVNSGVYEALHKNDIRIKHKINEFVEKYKNNFTPQINQISAFFRSVNEDEYMVILPSIELTSEGYNRAKNMLYAIKIGKPFEEVEKEFDDLYKLLFENYGYNSYGSKRLFIGDKVNRRCRFCGLTKEETTFKNKAHAISEGLGNKNVFLYEECDSCNDKFSVSIEPDLIGYFSFYRTFYDIKGKGGSKKIKGKDLEISKSKNVEIVYNDHKKLPDLESLESKLTIETPLDTKIRNQDIYRCLVKFCLSVMKNEELNSFKKTIKWVNSETSFDILPWIAEYESKESFTPIPKLTLYKRHNDNKHLPYTIGQFHLATRTMLFIVPFSGKDGMEKPKDFLKTIWSVFKHLPDIDKWSFNDFSSEEEKDFTLKFSFYKSDDKN